MLSSHPLLLALLVLLLFIVLWLFLSQKKLKKELASEIKEKQQIISIVSHDIKSPFNRISALEQLIAMDDNKLSHDQQEYLDKMHQVVADGLGLIRNLVDYRNLEYRNISIIPEKFNLSKLVANAVKSVESLANKKNQRIMCELENDVMILSDHQLVSRAVDNVLSNAIKFSPLDKNIEVTLTTRENEVRLEVKDEAAGFSAQELTKLFNKFEKLSARPTGGESSTGLGLYITRVMLGHVKGSITCASREQEGSTFTIVLPRSINN